MAQRLFALVQLIYQNRWAQSFYIVPPELMSELDAGQQDLLDNAVLFPCHPRSYHRHFDILPITTIPDSFRVTPQGHYDYQE
jgi:hypothetical protein